MKDPRKKIYGHSQQPSDYIFPQEYPNGTIKIDGDWLICEGNHGIYSCKVNIDELQYAYVLVDHNGKSFLLLSDGIQHSIPTMYAGFKETYIALTKEFGFDDDVFFKHVHQKQAVKQEIWRKLGAPTFEVLKDKLYNDYAEGFEIQSPQKCFIDWDTPHDVLANHAYVYADDSSDLKFSFPIRIGNIVLQNLSFYKNADRADAPVPYFHSKCFDSTSSDKSYDELKSILLKDFAERNQLPGNERQDQRSFSFRAAGMYINLGYNYNSDWSTEGFYTLFSVENRRDYSELLDDKGYEAAMEISDVLLLSGPINTSDDYKRNKRIKLRPAKLKERYGDESLIWIDRKNDKIGFAANYYCQVFASDEIKSLVIQNVQPAKGPGGAYLEISFADERYNYTILTGNTYVFDQYQMAIQKLTGKDVAFASEYYNC